MPPIAAEHWRDLLCACLDFTMATELFSGKLPLRLAENSRDRGFSIIPEDFQSFHSKCSCPDWSNPCKHIAAVHMLVAYEINRDPLLLLKFRGMEKEILLESIESSFQQFLGINQHAPEFDSQDGTANGVKCDTVAQDCYNSIDDGLNNIVHSIPLPLPELAKSNSSLTLARFWNGIQVPLSSGFYDALTDRTAIDCPLLDSLGAFPLWRSSFNFKNSMMEAYCASALAAKEKIAR